MVISIVVTIIRKGTIISIQKSWANKIMGL
nr:MAG TPA: hypothetical protein [Crassvirales sp.]